MRTKRKQEIGQFKHMAALVKNYRLAKGMSQTELSLALDFKNGQAVSNTERGISSIPIKKAVKLSELLDIPLDEIRMAYLRDFNDYNLNRFMPSKTELSIIKPDNY